MAVAATPEPDGSADAIMRVLALARERLDMDVAVLGECAGGRETFAWVDAGAGAELAEDISVPLADSYYQRLLDNRVPNIVHDAQAEDCVRDLDVTRELGIGAWVGVPVTLPDGRPTARSAASAPRRDRR